MSDFGGNKAGKVDGGPARCIGPCTYIVEPLLERPLFYQAAGEKTLILAMCILWSLKFWEMRIFVYLGDGLTIEGTKNSPQL